MDRSSLRVKNTVGSLEYKLTSSTWIQQNTVFSVTFCEGTLAAWQEDEYNYGGVPGVWTVDQVSGRWTRCPDDVPGVWMMYQVSG